MPKKKCINEVTPEEVEACLARGKPELRERNRRILAIALDKNLPIAMRSAGAIAARLGLKSRNVVIGLFNRLGTTHENVRSELDKAHGRRGTARNTARKAAQKVQEVTPKPASPMRIEAADHIGEVVVNLAAHMCRWPIGDVQDKNFKFCGARRRTGPYCDHHARLAYQPLSKLKRIAIPM